MRHRSLAAFPQLRHVNIVGDTANPEEPGHDLTYQARAGLLQGVMPLTLLADMVGAERAHATIKDVMREPGGEPRGRPLRHASRSGGAALSRADVAGRTSRRRQFLRTASTRRERARSRWARSSRTSARDCMKASDCRRATIRAPSMPPGRRSSGSSGPPPATCRSSRCGRSGVRPPFLPATGMIGDGAIADAQTGLRNCARASRRDTWTRSRRAMSAATRHAARCVMPSADHCRKARRIRSPC